MVNELNPRKSAAVNGRRSPAGRRSAEHGDRVAASSSRVTPEDCRTKAMVSPITSAWDVPISSTEVTKILNGFRPRDMDDKWVAYTEGPDAHGEAIITIARSWTGFVMSKVKMQVPERSLGGPSPRLTEITWEAENERYNGSRERTQREKDMKYMFLNLLRYTLEVSMPRGEGGHSFPDDFVERGVSE